MPKKITCSLTCIRSDHETFFHLNVIFNRVKNCRTNHARQLLVGQKIVGQMLVGRISLSNIVDMFAPVKKSILELSSRKLHFRNVIIIIRFVVVVFHSYMGHGMDADFQLTTQK